MRKYQSRRAIAENLARMVPDQAVPGQADGSAAAAQFSRESIEKLAYQYWLNRGCPSGSAEEDWYQAERALMAEAEMDRGEVQPLAGAVMRAGG
jgi:Protein of unknown function (DUF2934)